TYTRPVRACERAAERRTTGELAQAQDAALICHPFTRNYELVNAEILDESSTLVIFRKFAPPYYIKDFREDVRKQNLVEQVLSYCPGGHYALHDDYITYTSPDTYDSWKRDYGNRMAIFFLLLQSAHKGGGTVSEAGDVVSWTNVNYTGEMEVDALHGGCPVYEGEKIAATLWIRMKGQDLFRSASNRLNIRELMER
ncbi:hypothetical protein GCK32_013626, partial [Trichostrongylus colubriformis]